MLKNSDERPFLKRGISMADVNSANQRIKERTKEINDSGTLKKKKKVRAQPAQWFDSLKSD